MIIFYSFEVCGVLRACAVRVCVFVCFYSSLSSRGRSIYKNIFDIENSNGNKRKNDLPVGM